MIFAFVITNLKGGGAEKAILKTIDILLHEGHECFLFLLKSGCDYTLPKNINIQIVGSSNLWTKGWLGKRFLAAKLRFLIGQVNPNLVVSTLPFADEVTYLANIPNHWCRIANTLSVEIENLALKNQSKSRRRLLKYQRIYGTRNLIAVSQGVAQDLKDKLNIKSHIEVIPNPFNKIQILEKANNNSHIKLDKPFILYVGRFAPQKRHDLLLDAFLKVPDQFDLVMLTPPDSMLQEMIDSRNLTQRVHVMGFSENPYAWMSKAELLVLTSDREGLPNVLIESLLCGTPVISTDCPSGPREILADIAPGSLVPCSDLPALISAINHQLSRQDKPLSVDLTRYDQNKTLEAYERLITHLER